jgi:hypothetical protein
MVNTMDKKTTDKKTKKITKQQLKKTLSKKDFLLYEKEQLELKRLQLNSELRKIATKEQQKKRKDETREKILLGSILIQSLKENLLDKDSKTWLSRAIQNFNARDLKFMQNLCNRFNINDDIINDENEIINEGNVED